jgi:hypothetical protein
MTFILFFWICYWIGDDNYVFFFLWSIVFDANNDTTSILCMKDEGRNSLGGELIHLTT